MLDEEDSEALQKTKLENKLMLLTVIMEHYNDSIRQKLQMLVDYLKEGYARMKELQMKAN